MFMVINTDKKKEIKSSPRGNQIRGFTDRNYTIDFILTWIYTFLCLILTILGSRIGIEDYSYITIVCPLVWAHFGLHTGFVVWKAKVENLSKNAGKKVFDNANTNINMDI